MTARVARRQNDMINYVAMKYKHNYFLSDDDHNDEYPLH